MEEVSEILTAVRVQIKRRPLEQVVQEGKKNGICTCTSGVMEHMYVYKIRDQEFDNNQRLFNETK